LQRFNSRPGDSKQALSPERGEKSPVAHNKQIVRQLQQGSGAKGDINMEQYTLKELEHRAELRSRQCDLMLETLYLIMRSQPEDLKEINIINKEIDAIATELGEGIYPCFPSELLPE
jgi:hypothetical protein